MAPVSCKICGADTGLFLVEAPYGSKVWACRKHTIFGNTEGERTFTLARPDTFPNAYYLGALHRATKEYEFSTSLAWEVFRKALSEQPAGPEGDAERERLKLDFRMRVAGYLDEYDHACALAKKLAYGS